MTGVAPVQLALQRVGCHSGRVEVLHDFTLHIRKGDAISFVGPSGSGKPTLLRTIVGLTKPSSGEVCLDGAPINYGERASLARDRERMAIVFQQCNLFQNMTVMAHVIIVPIRVRGESRGASEDRAAQILRQVGLSAKHRAYPDELSGGKQQRVAIARALMLDPDILLLDEVTSALDPELVTEVRDTISGLAAQGMTLLIVSHEMGFVRNVSSRVVMMDAGRVVEQGAPAEVFDTPATKGRNALSARYSGIERCGSHEV